MNQVMKTLSVLAVMIVGSFAAQHVRMERHSERCLNNAQKLRASFDGNQPRHGVSMIRSKLGQAEQLCLEKPDYANQMLSNTAAVCVLQNGCRQYRIKVSSQPVFR